MRPADILNEMDEIKKQWRADTFQATAEVHRRYNELRILRRERIKQLVEEGRVIEPGTMQS